MTEREAVELMRERVSPQLLQHCLDVGSYNRELAHRWGAPVDEAELAGVLHDLCRELTAAQVLQRAAELGVPVTSIDRLRPVQLLHAKLAAAELQSQDLNAACLQAIARHTIGGAGMTVLEKCLYVADAAEPGRHYEGVAHLRKLATESLDAAVAESCKRTLARLVERGKPIHPDSVALYNELAV